MKLPRDQFEKLALEQMDLLYRTARRLTGNSDQASDLVQETYLHALKAAHTFDLQEHGIRPWLVRIMHNVYFTQFTRGKRQPVAMELDTLEATGPQPPGQRFPYQAGSEGMDERMVKALEQLAPDYRSILLLWAVEDFSYKDIAEALDIPIGTVMSRLYRARHLLTALLRDYAKEEGIIRE